jgi:RHS repeat-associated protein
VSFFYDGATAPGVLTRGNPTRTELGWTRDGVPTVLRTVRTFDSYGNERSLISPRDPADTGTEARWLRSTLYDTASYTFPTRISETSYGAPAVDNLEIQLEYEGIVGCGAPKGLGLACEVTGPSEQPTTSFYDGFGRLVRREAPNGSQTAVLYRDLGMAGQRIETRTRWSVDGASGSALESDPAALIAETYFDGLGRPVLETRSGQGSNVARRFLSYDAAGRLASASRWDFAGTAVYPTLFRYDGLGRETLVTLPGGSTVASSYNATSVFQVATEGIAQISKRETWSDGHGRVLAIDEYPSVTSTSHERTVFLYDPFGQLALVGDPITQNPSLCGTNPACPGQRHSTAILYDELGNPTRRDEPDAGTWSWRYNAAGLIDEQQDPAGQVLTYGYDFMGRLQVVHPVDLPVPEADRVFVYGPGNDSDTSRRGRLVEVYDDEGYDTFAYDDAGNVAEHVRAVDGRRFPFQREYDPLGRVRLAIYPDGEWVTWEYDKALVSRISGQYGEYSGDYLASATYDALDRPTNLELGGSAGDAVLEQSWIHDPVTGHLDRSTAVLGETGATLATLNYTFDDFGRLERYEQTWRTNPPPDGTEFERRLFFEHDGLGRIKQIEDPLCGAIPIYCIYDYAYDAVGNITLMGVNEFNNGHDLEYRDPLRPHALTAAVPRGGSLRRDLAYDAAGRVGEETFSGVGGATRSFAYDAYGLPAQAGSLYFGYDWRGQRVRSYAKPDGSDGKSAHPEPDYSYQNGNSNKHFFVAGARIASSKRFFIPESASAPVVFTWRGPHLPVWSTTVSLGVAWGSIVSLLLGIAIRRSSRHPLRLRLGSVGVIALAAPMLLAGRPRVNFGIHETTVLFYATDHLGSTILAVKPTSGSANPIHLHSLHAPFGGTLLQGGATTLEKRWIGASRLPAGTGDYELYALGPRLYSPLAGHFYQPDPLLGSGDEPQTWNPYAYAANAPVERKDASGFCVGEPPCGPPVPTPSGDDEYHADASPDWTQSRGPGSVREHLFPLRTGGGGAPSMATNVTSPRVDVWSQSSAAAADPCAGGACGAHDVFDFLYALPVAGRALGAAGTAAAIRVAVPLAVRFPGTAAVLGFGAPAALVSRAGEVGRATGNLGTVLTPALERTVNSVLRGSEPLSALTVQQRQVSAVFFQNVATRSSVLATKGAAEFNIARARFLEGLSSTPPGLLAEFLARQGGH